MRVRLLAFARLRELLGWSEREVELPAAARADDVWRELETQCGDLAPLRHSTRLAVNGAVVPHWDRVLQAGDEVALLPPSSGG